MGFERMGGLERREKMGGSDKYSERDRLERVYESESAPELVAPDPHEMERKRREEVEKSEKVSAQLKFLQSFQKGAVSEKMQEGFNRVDKERQGLVDASREYQSKYGVTEQGEVPVQSEEILGEGLAMQKEISDLEDTMRRIDSSN